MGAVAGEAFEAAPLGGDAGVGGALPEDRLDLLRALLVHLGRRLDELGVGKADGRGVGDGQRLGMQADQMGFVAGGERAGAIADAFGVFGTLDDGENGLERHGFLQRKARRDNRSDCIGSAAAAQGAAGRSQVLQCNLRFGTRSTPGGQSLFRWRAGTSSQKPILPWGGRRPSPRPPAWRRRAPPASGRARQARSRTSRRDISDRSR